MQKPFPTILALMGTLVTGACTGSGIEPSGPVTGSGNLPATGGGLCLIEGESPRSGGVVKDGIPALSDPWMVGSDDPLASYVLETDRVIGVNYGGEWLAFPLNIMRWHEVVNLNGGASPLALTYCPLTGSGMAFDRSPVGGNEFGVSGLLWRSNLIMYDRGTQESLWPQMRGRADCGPRAGTVLPQLPVSDMTWGAWKALHPDTRVVSQNTGWERDYRANPYEDYERLDAPPPSDMKWDLRRQPKERVLGIPTSRGGFAIPFGAFPQSSKAVLNLTLPGEGATEDGIPVVVFWDGASQSAEAFYPIPEWISDPGPGGGEVNFEVKDQQIVDSGTGTIWTVDGRAVDGSAAGSRLKEVRGSLVSFWFAWAAFYPDTELFDESGM